MSENVDLERFERCIVHYCAPTLAGFKPGNLFNFSCRFSESGAVCAGQSATNRRRLVHAVKNLRTRSRPFDLNRILAFPRGHSYLYDRCACVPISPMRPSLVPRGAGVPYAADSKPACSLQGRSRGHGLTTEYGRALCVPHEKRSSSFPVRGCSGIQATEVVITSTVEREGLRKRTGCTTASALTPQTCTETTTAARSGPVDRGPRETDDDLHRMPEMLRPDRHRLQSLRPRPLEFTTAGTPHESVRYQEPAS